MSIVMPETGVEHEEPIFPLERLESLVNKYIQQQDVTETKRGQILLRIIRFHDKHEREIETYYKSRLQRSTEIIDALEQEVKAVKQSQDALIQNTVAEQGQLHKVALDDLEEIHRVRRETNLNASKNNTRSLLDEQERLHATTTANLEIRYKADYEKLRTENGTIIASLNDNNTRLTQNLTGTKQHFERQLQDQAQTHQQRTNELEGERLSQEQFYENLIGEIERKHEDEKSTAAAISAAKIQSMNDGIAKSFQDHEEEKSAMQEDFDTQKQSIRERVEKLVHDHEDEKEAITEAFEVERQRARDDFARAENRHKDDIQSIRADFAGQKRTLEDKFNRAAHDQDSERQSMLADFAMERKTLEDGLARAAYNHEEDKKAMQRSHAMEKKTLTNDFTARSAGMKADLGRLSAVLMGRDDDLYKAQFFNFSGKPLEDPVLKSMFLELAKLVDDMGRSDWTLNRQSWSDRTLNRLCKVQNLTSTTVKIYIVKDCIWNLLYQHIFCSPFRVFGSEGIVLEDQWIKHDKQETPQDNSNGHTESFFAWPKPQFETERWRYINVRECRNVLRLKLSEHDPRAKLKKSYVNQTGRLTKELESCLSGMIDLDKKNREILDNLRMSAVRLWLEFGMQRCRLRITMHDMEVIGTDEKALQAENRSIKLVPCPGLSRQGNVSGFEFNERLTLKGCDGEVIQLP